MRHRAGTLPRETPGPVPDVEVDRTAQFMIPPARRQLSGGLSPPADGVRETSAVDADLPVTPAVTIPAGELSWRFSRAGGPGGQGVNTADSRVELSWDVGASQSLPEELRERALGRLAGRLVDGVLTVVASEHRAQLRNREAARGRLAVLIREAIAPPAPPRRPTRPSRRQRQRRLDDKRHRGQVKRLRRPED